MQKNYVDMKNETHILSLYSVQQPFQLASNQWNSHKGRYVDSNIDCISIIARICSDLHTTFIIH